MNYIYDIVLNFHKNYYQFFEWTKKDKIINIKKISVYHVTNKDILILKNNKIKVNTTFIDKIKKDNPNHKKIMCLVSNKKQALALLFTNSGNLLKRSSLIFEEEEEVNDLAKLLPLTQITYLENKEVIPQNILRIEKEQKYKLIKFIKETTQIEILKYLYYEYFKQENNNKEEMRQILLQEIKKDWTTKQQTLYNTIDMISKNNLPTK